MLAKSLGTDGALSYLERLSEGRYTYDNKKPLDVRECINVPQNRYKKDKTDIIYGKKVSLEDFEIQEDGVYYIDRGDSLSIIEIKEGKVSYKLNNIEL